MVESEYVDRVLIAIFKLCLRKITIKILLVPIRQIDNSVMSSPDRHAYFLLLFGSDRSPNNVLETSHTQET